MNKNDNRWAFDLVVDGNDISQYVCSDTKIDRNLVEWLVHTELTCNRVTNGTMRRLNGQKVWVKYRMRLGGFCEPWHSGRAEVNWRITPVGRGELILHGRGQLKKDKASTKAVHSEVKGKVTIETLVEGRVIEKTEDEGIISFVEESPCDRTTRAEQRQLAEDNQIQAITSPEFVLFLADSARLTYRLLYDLGKPDGIREVTYASFIFLPLATEYYLKYLILMNAGELKKKQHTHKLLRLFDDLPVEVQESIEEAFRGALVKIGREGTSQNLRVFLMKSQDAFTAIRYLYDPEYATAYRHLVKPDNIALLTCVLDAVERVSKGL